MKSYPLRYILPAALLLIISMVVFSVGVMPGAPRPSDQTGGAQQFYEPYGRQVRALSPTGGSRYSADDDFIDWRRTTDRISSHTQDKEAVKITSGVSVKNDVSPPLRNMKQLPPRPMQEHEANENPKISRRHLDYQDRVIQTKASPNAMPTPILNFDGIPFPGVACNCSPPDTNGEVGTTQYVQIVNEGYQVFNKSTGASVLGPSSIVSLWAGFGGVCQNNGQGDPIVLFDQFTNRWIISQFAGTSVPTDECIAVSTTSDATGSYNRYDFNLGTNFFDYPHLSVWPDGYYMSMNVFNTAGDTFLGPQAFAFDRTAMLAGNTATFVTTGVLGDTLGGMLPADLDGSTFPPAGAPDPFLMDMDDGLTWRLYRFHADFITPANSTFTFNTLTGAAYTELCPTTRSCIPQPNTPVGLDGIGDRPMFRLAYRRFVDGHEALAGNKTVSAGGVSGIRWFEINNATSGTPTFVQQSTYQPDTTWRWMGSAAMDAAGNLGLGFSVSSGTVFPGVSYAGRLAGDPANTLGQGEATLVTGAGVQTSSRNRWGDYSDMTIDPLDDCTFWYTQEYYLTTASVNWKTRIGSFKFPGCAGSAPAPQPLLASAGAAVITSESFSPPNGAPDPGEQLTANFPLKNVGTGPTTNVVATLQNSGGITAIPTGENQNYGALAANGAPVSMPFVFSADGTCGGTITATLHLQDGTNDLGNATYNFQLGTTNTTTTFTENFDGVSAPVLPAGWTTTATGPSATLWVTSTTTPNSAPNDAFAPDLTKVADDQLVSPPLAIPAAGGQVTFKNLYNTESDFDGMVLEISIPTVNAGAFQDIITAGGSFAAGGYNATILFGSSSPIANRAAWSGLSAGTTTTPAYITTTVHLPAAANGQNIQLKWRAASDVSVAASGAAGVRVDDVTINTSTPVCTPAVRIDSMAPLAGRTSGGQQIILTGSFANLSSVKMGGSPASFFYTNGGGDTSMITVTTPAHAVGAVDIVLTPSVGGALTKTNAFAYLPTVFTDDTITVGQTTAKAQHILELRQAVDAMRAVAGLSGAPWSDPALAPGNTIRAVHITELRTFLDDAATRLGFSTSPYTEPGLTTGFVIKRIHIEELRQRIRTIAG